MTLDDTNFADAGARLSLLEQRVGTPFVSAIVGGVTTECDLVAQGRWDNRLRSALYDPATNSYLPDSLGDPAISATDLRALAQAPGQATTFTCVPSGSGTRVALDRDEDGTFHHDEALSSTDPGNPGSVPGACNDGIDNDGDGTVDLADPGCAASASNIENPQCNDGFDNDGDGTADYGGDPDCSDPASSRELALPPSDCRVGRMDPSASTLWFVMILVANAWE